jgi:hypothetical protein
MDQGIGLMTSIPFFRIDNEYCATIPLSAARGYDNRYDGFKLVPRPRRCVERNEYRSDPAAGTKCAPRSANREWPAYRESLAPSG